MIIIGCIIAIQLAFVALGWKHQRNKRPASKPAPVIQLNDYRKDAA